MPNPIPRFFRSAGPAPSGSAAAPGAVPATWIPAAATPQLFPPTRPGLGGGHGEAVQREPQQLL